MADKSDTPLVIWIQRAVRAFFRKNGTEALATEMLRSKTLVYWNQDHEGRNLPRRSPGAGHSAMFARTLIELADQDRSSIRPVTALFA